MFIPSHPTYPISSSPPSPKHGPPPPSPKHDPPSPVHASPSPPHGSPLPNFQDDTTRPKMVAVAIDKDRGSQAALKWTLDTFCHKGQTILLIHVKFRPPGSVVSALPRIGPFDGNKGGQGLDRQTSELFLPYRVFCSRKDVHCVEVVLEDNDVAKSLIEYVRQAGIEVLTFGAGSKGGLFRFKLKDIPGNLLKGAPDFCSVYAISKGKISNSRAASLRAPKYSPLRSQMLMHCSSNNSISNASDSPRVSSQNLRGTSRPMRESSQQRHTRSGDMKSAFTHRKRPDGKSYELSSPSELDISFVSNDRPSMDSGFPSSIDDFEDGSTPPYRISGLSDYENRRSFESLSFNRRSSSTTPPPELASYASLDSASSMSQSVDDDVDEEMKRLKKELKQTMDMYSSACKEAHTAKQKALELQRWKMEEQRKLDETRSEETAVAQAEKEKYKSRIANEHAVAAQRIADIEKEKRLEAEKKAIVQAEETNKGHYKMEYSDCRYRRYTIEEIEVATEYFSGSRKVGEGGYGPVYKCYLDHTPAAVKVLRPDAAQGRSQFQQEVEVLCCIRHPNMVLLLGACPEYGCLVYEYMSNGSLEDRLLQKGKTPPLSWQHRFRIAAEITRGLLFLHQTKPEPIVHRDLKPGNILLDRNLVSKISDVGLARLVPPSVADTVTQYRMTSTAGTFCYIDPEYQQTGMLGVKSDVYSLGIIFLQILTARPPMGLTHYVGKAIEEGTFSQMLDPTVHDWPVEEALSLAKVALQCSELRRKDRPDLGKVVMPQLERLCELSEESSNLYPFSGNPSPHHRSEVSMSGDEGEYPRSGFSGVDS